MTPVHLKLTISIIKRIGFVIPSPLSDKLAYLGWSWGGFMGGIMPAVEKRIKVVVLNVGGMEMRKTLPEVDQINFIPRYSAGANAEWETRHVLSSRIFTETNV